MRAARLATVVALLLVTPVVATAAAKGPSTPAAPKGLHGFLLRPSEPVAHTFPRTPAFAWRPVRGAACYEFQLATSRTFDGSSVVWSNVSAGTNAARSCGGSKLDIPATSISLTLPWFTGQAIRALRPRPRSHDARRDASGAPVRVQHALGRAPGADGDEARARAVDARRGRDVVSGLVHGHPQVVHDAHERRRPARVLHLPRRRQLVRDDSLARPRGSPRARDDPERPARGLVRSVEPRVRRHEPGAHDGQASSSRSGLRRDQLRLEARRAPAHARSDVLGQPGRHRPGSGRCSASTPSPTRTASTSCSAAPSSEDPRSRLGSPAR